MSSVILRRAPLAHLLVRPGSSVSIDFAALEAMLRTEGVAASHGRSGSERYEVVVADDLPALQARHIVRRLQAAGYHARFSPTDELRYSQPVCLLMWLGVVLFGCLTLELLALAMAGFSARPILAAVLIAGAASVGMMVHLFRCTVLGRVHRRANAPDAPPGPVPV